MGYGLANSRGTSKLLIKNLEQQKFKVVILDESHYLKNRKANRTKVLHSITKKAKRTILLSGTPSLARPEEVGFETNKTCHFPLNPFTPKLIIQILLTIQEQMYE